MCGYAKELTLQNTGLKIIQIDDKKDYIYKWTN